MRITSLTISNLRGVEYVNLTDLRDFVVIAGPNGCGKTTVLDAIRLLKSVYVSDEYKRWFGEFGVAFDKPSNWAALFRNSSVPASISAEIELNDSEREFLIVSAENIALSTLLADMPQRKGSRFEVTGAAPLIPPELSSARTETLRREARERADNLVSRLREAKLFRAGVTLDPGRAIHVDDSPVARAAFGCFNPQNLGEIEFHSSRRTYTRESVDNIRLRLASRDEERRNRFLYDLDNKYKNIKTQLGEEFVSSRLHPRGHGHTPLQRSVQELFLTFFPGKEFLGVGLESDGSLKFPVRLGTGEDHDIDELSSGEKEIVYGYLWLRTGTPRHSVILVDEPELHLNPALVHALPLFYKTHLGDALSAQVWIVTHSDAILQQAVRSQDMTVFHMARPDGKSSGQAMAIDNKDAVEAAVLDLVGDIAAYRPHATIVLIEGTQETRFDVDVIRRLFPELEGKANFIPVGPRRMTHGIRERITEVIVEAGMSQRVISISDSDRDFGDRMDDGVGAHFVWPAYEIENFLLDPKVIRVAAKTVLRTDPFSSDDDVVEKLRLLADPLVRDMARMEMQEILNDEMVRALHVGGDPSDPVASFRRSTENAKRRVSEIDNSETRLSSMFAECESRFRLSLSGNEFLYVLPGKRLLQTLANKLRIPQEVFRNVCLDSAQRIGLRPEGMEKVLTDALGLH